MVDRVIRAREGDTEFLRRQLEITESRRTAPGFLYGEQNGQDVIYDPDGNAFYPVDTSSGNVTLTLAAATETTGKSFTYYKKDAANTLVVVDTGGTGQATLTAQASTVTLKSEGTAYRVTVPDVSEYVTSASLSTALAPYITSASVSAALSAYLPLAGGTMTGDLTLAADPSASFHAATKQYVDAQATSLVVSTAQSATASAVAFTKPAAITMARRVTVVLDQVSLSGTDNLLVQIGDSGGIETTGYSSVANGTGGNQANTSSTSGFVTSINAAAASQSGNMRLYRISGNIWDEDHLTADGSSTHSVGAGRKELSAELDRVTVTATGTNTFDAGLITVFWE